MPSKEKNPPFNAVPTHFVRPKECNRNQRQHSAVLQSTLRNHAGTDSMLRETEATINSQKKRNKAFLCFERYGPLDI